VSVTPQNIKIPFLREKNCLLKNGKEEREVDGLTGVSVDIF